MAHLCSPGSTRVALLLTGLMLSLTASAHAQERVVIGGAGAHLPVMTSLAEAYRMRQSSDVIEVVAKQTGSTGAIRGVEAGALTVGLTSRPLHGDEQRALVYRVYGRTPLVIGVHPDVSVKSLTERQLCAIFSGRITSWKDLGGPDARIVVLTRNEDGTKSTVREQIACFRDLTETPDAVVMTKAAAMGDALSRRASTIGLIDLVGLIDAERRFKAVAIDGVVPSVASLRSGQYRLSKTFGVVTLGEPQGAVRRFLNFVTGPEGERIMGRHGLVVVR